MLNIDSNKQTVPHSTFLAITSRIRRVYFDGELYRDLVEKDGAVIKGLETNMLEYMNLHSDGKFDRLTRNGLARYLTEYEDVSPKYMERYDTKKRAVVMSMDESVINSLVKENVSPYLMGLYVEYQQLESKYNFARSQLDALKPTGMVDKFNNKVEYMPFYYNEKATGRIYTSSVSMQSLSHRYNEAIVAPKDYYLLWADFAQIDLRVALELCLSGEGSLRDNLMKYEDKYEAFSRSMHEDMSMEFSFNNFKEDRGKYKAGILAPIYCMGRGAVINKVQDNKIGGSIFDYINNNKKYKQYVKAVDENVLSGVDYYCSTYFGTKMPISQKTHNKKTASVNKPIQGTSSDIMKIVTVEIYNRMAKHLGDELKVKFIPLLNRHDEMIFLIHKTATPYLYELTDCTRIQVDDWAPLTLEWNAGYSYQEPDEELEEDIKSIMSYKVTPKKTMRRQTTFKHVPKTKMLNWSVLKYANYTFSLVQSFFDSTACFTVHKNGLKFEGLIKEMRETWEDEMSQYDRIVMYNENSDYRVVDGVEYVVHMPGNTNNYITEKMCKGLASRYINNVLEDSPPQEWEDNGDISLRRGVRLVCQTEIL